MLIERQVVSRKTSGDGRLEITRRAADRLRDLGHVLEVELSGQHSSATLESKTCTCRGDAKPHAHYFLQSSTFKRLTPGTEIDLELDEAVGVVRLISRGREA